MDGIECSRSLNLPHGKVRTCGICTADLVANVGGSFYSSVGIRIPTACSVFFAMCLLLFFFADSVLSSSHLFFSFVQSVFSAVL